MITHGTYITWWLPVVNDHWSYAINSNFMLVAHICWNKTLSVKQFEQEALPAVLPAIWSAAHNFSWLPSTTCYYQTSLLPRQQLHLVLILAAGSTLKTTPSPSGMSAWLFLLMNTDNCNQIWMLTMPWRWWKWFLVAFDYGLTLGLLIIFSGALLSPRPRGTQVTLHWSRREVMSKSLPINVSKSKIMKTEICPK